MSNDQRKVGMWGEPREDQVELALEPREPRAAEVADAAVAQAPGPGQATCAGCQRNLDVIRMELSNGQLMCKTCIHNQRTASVPAAPDAVSVSGLAASAIGGAVGALAGGGVWAGIAIATDFEVGYVAVLVGFLAGMGVRWGAGGRRGPGLQLLAAVLAIAGMLAAKYFIFAYVLIGMGHKQGVDIGVFDHMVWSNFPALLGETVGVFDALFAFLAVAAAARACKPT